MDASKVPTWLRLPENVLERLDVIAKTSGITAVDEVPSKDYSIVWKKDVDFDGKKN
jgi:hypothetical protein